MDISYKHYTDCHFEYQECLCLNNFDFQWLGDEFAEKAMTAIDNSLIRLGGFLVERMESYAAVDTGTMKAGIHDKYDFSTHTLIVADPVPWSVWQEFGTRYTKPHPFFRPAILDVGPTWEGIPIDFTLIIHPPAQMSEPLRATTSGFRLPKKQKLSAGQLAHVKKHLIPTSRKFAAKFKRRKIGFKVQGPK